jgi:hypothetical protein
MSSATMRPRSPELLLALEGIELSSRASTFSERRSTLVVLQAGDKVPEVVGLVHVSSVRHIDVMMMKEENRRDDTDKPTLCIHISKELQATVSKTCTQSRHFVSHNSPNLLPIRP